MLLLRRGSRWVSAWKEGLPTVAEVQWSAAYGKTGGVMEGVDERRGRNMDTEEQREHLESRRKLDPHFRGGSQRFKNWRNEMKEQQKEQARERGRHAAPYTDDLIKSKMVSVRKTRHTTVDSSFLDGIDGVNPSKQAVQDAFMRLNGVDLATSSDVIHISNPPSVVFPNTRGMFRGAKREEMNKVDYSLSASWYTGERTVVLFTENNGAGYAWARACPDVTFICLSDLVSGYFRSVSNGCGQDEVPPENMRFVRTHAPMYFQLDEAVPDESIDEVLFMFPSTFPTGDSSKRLPTAGFLQLLHPKLKIGGKVRLATWNSAFYDWANLEFEKCHCEWNRALSPDMHHSPLLLTGRSSLDAPLGKWAVHHLGKEPLVSEWEKTSNTPENVRDMNEQYSFRRVSNGELSARG